MPSRRRRTSSTHKATAAAEPQTKTAEVPAEASRPVVTQVVEVVEEVGDMPTAEEAKEKKSQKTESEEIVGAVSEESFIAQEPSRESMMQETEEEPQKRKEMVEELYTGRKEPQMMPEISVHSDKSGKPIIVWAVVTIVVAVLTGSILFAVTKKSVHIPSFIARPTPTPTPAPPTPTPTPATIDKSSFEIQVLNGGGTAGAATKMKQFLEGKGYKVGATGNTDEFTYDKTEIHTKSNMQAAITILEADLKDTYTLGTSAADLTSDAPSDVRVIVGK